MIPPNAIMRLTNTILEELVENRLSGRYPCPPLRYFGPAACDRYCEPASPKRSRTAGSRLVFSPAALPSSRAISAGTPI